MISSILSPHAVVQLAQDLINCPSITPQDHGCQVLIRRHLREMGFECESMPLHGIDNLWAYHPHSTLRSPLLVLAGHTDVVPPGLVEQWTFPPFQATLHQGCLFGRGAVDMKGALAAMIVAVQRFLHLHPQHRGTIAFLLTSDEEGPAVYGTQAVIAALQQRRIKIDYVIVGEPSSHQHIGDQVRIGRRGSLHGKIVIHGKQGHIAYPQLARNPIHLSLAALHELTTVTWDNGNEHFPPTTLQYSNIHSGQGVYNVIPEQLEVVLNFRFSPVSTPSQLQQQVSAILQRHAVPHTISWEIGAQPFLSAPGQLFAATSQAIQTITGFQTHISTDGGTSDGRFFAPTGAEIIEIGARHETAHHINEHIVLQDLHQLVEIYFHLLTNLLA